MRCGSSSCSAIPTPRSMDGGRLKWEKEGRPLIKDVPAVPITAYHAPDRTDYKIRAFRDDVLKHIQVGLPLVDVRSPGEYSGQLFHMEDYPQEGALRTGHIPGAVSRAVGQGRQPGRRHLQDGRAVAPALRAGAGLEAGDSIIAYCRIGERSSHTWFVLKYLLGYPNVRNYDGSWTEWGNLVGVPIER